MNQKLSRFNWSLKKLLLTEPDTFNKSRLKIMYTILTFALIKAALLVPIALQNEQYFQAGRGVAIFLVNIFLLKLLLYEKSYGKLISHYIVWMGILVIWSNLTFTVQAINLVTIQLVFMVMLAGFYLLSTKFGIIYTALGSLPVVAVLIIHGKQPLEAVGNPEELASPAYEIIVILNFITLCIAHYLFHRAFRANIREKVVLNQELQNAVSEANNYAKSKSDFLSTMSHELRTPLNSVIGMTELLLEDPHNKEQKENLNILSFSALSLKALINDILDFNKIESGKLHFEKISVDLSELVSRISAGLRLQATEKGLTLQLKIDDSIKDVHVYTDPTRITQIIYNLVGNAIKFTQQGQVELELTELVKSGQKLTVRFSITDTGIGISQEKHDSIFEPFTQASRNTTRNFGGTGLGLAIVKRLLELFDSEVVLESELGKGSTFSFDIIFDIDEAAVKVDAPGREQDYDLTGLRVLVAEDNQINVLLLKKILSKWNIEPVIAENGLQAVEKHSTGSFDVILMDIHMPLMDGYQATNEIRKLADPVKSSIPIIALTASVSTQEHKINGKGMTDYIYKPFNSRDLYAKLKKIMA